MRLVVLDTNVIVSAGIRANSIPFQIVSEWVLEGRVQMVTCPSIVEEYRSVTSRPKFARYDFPPKWLDFLVEDSLRLSEPPLWPGVLPDDSDAPFLAAAKLAGAWLVSGNLKHFPVAARQGVKVLSPADYLAHLLAG